MVQNGLERPVKPLKRVKKSGVKIPIVDRPIRLATPLYSTYKYKKMPTKINFLKPRTLTPVAPDHIKPLEFPSSEKLLENLDTLIREVNHKCFGPIIIDEMLEVEAVRKVRMTNYQKKMIKFDRLKAYMNHESKMKVEVKLWSKSLGISVRTVRNWMYKIKAGKSIKVQGQFTKINSEMEIEFIRLFVERSPIFVNQAV
jgi:hypothetical protein